MRRFAAGTVQLVVALVTGSLAQSGPFRPGDVLPAWTPGTLDIHQIVTGRGNAAFMMFPDGTTLLLDAGDSGGTDADQRPDASRTPAHRYGRFDYFSGGDMPGYPVPGAAAWHDEETDVHVRSARPMSMWSTTTAHWKKRIRSGWRRCVRA